MEEGAAPAAVRREVVIGTSDELGEDMGAWHSPGSAAHTAQPVLADVEEHVARIRKALLPSPAAHPSNQRCVFTAVCIRPDELQRVALLCDLLDQLYYWGVEEGTVLAQQPSALAQAEAPEVVYACITTQRPRLITSGLRVARELLAHPQSRSELLRVAGEYADLASATEPPDLDLLGRREAVYVALLSQLMQEYPGAVDVVAGVLGCAAAFLTTAHSEPISAGSSAGEAVLRSPLIAEALTALRRHQRDRGVCAQAVTLISVLAQQPRSVCHGGGDGEYVPTAVLLCQVGVVLPFMIAALTADWSCLDVRRPVLRFLQVCAGHRDNWLVLAERGAYTLAARVLAESDHVEDSFKAAAEIVGCLVPFLDGFQRRSLLLLIRRVLMQHGEPGVLSVALALLHVLLQHVSRTHKSGHGAERKQRGGGGEVPHSAFAAYMMYPPPPTTRASAAHDEGDALPLPKSASHLCASELLEQLDETDTEQFVAQLCLPQLVMHIADYYAREDTPQQDGQEDADVATLRTLSHRCLDMCINLRS